MIDNEDEGEGEGIGTRLPNDSGGDICAFLMERSAFSRRCFSRSSRLSSTSLSDSLKKGSINYISFGLACMVTGTLHESFRSLDGQ